MRTSRTTERRLALGTAGLRRGSDDRRHRRRHDRRADRRRATARHPAAGAVDYMWTPNADRARRGAEGEVNIVAWAGYVEDGSTDPAVDWVTPFEDITGCQVNVKTGNTSDEMVQLCRAASTTACRPRATPPSA